MPIHLRELPKGQRFVLTRTGDAEETEALTSAIDALEGITVVKYDPNGTTTEFTPCKLDIKA